MAGKLVKSVLAVAAAAGIVTGIAAPAAAYVEYLPVQDVYLFSEYYVGLNGTGGSWDAIANCNREAAEITNRAYVVTCTRTAYGARMDVYQQV